MRSTGPILAVGAITLGNKVIANSQPMDWRIPVMTGVAAGIFALAEQAWPEGAVAMAYLSLVAVLFVRIDKNVPAPTESFLKWLNG
jgi:hypothetical protein